MNKIIQNEKCYLCKVCINKCKKNAISFDERYETFDYPTINEELCINCKMCSNNCPGKIEHIKFEKPIKTLISQSASEEILKNTSSGGVFSVIAEEFLKNNGIVCGAYLNLSKKKTEHIIIDNIKDLKKIQGSKYVQSDIGDTYIQIEKYLKEDKKVLFSGTPCQVLGLKSYLKKEYQNLTTIDLVCHGTTSPNLFKSYIEYFEQKKKCKITGFRFRNKKYGWGTKGEITYKTYDGKTKRMIIDKNNCSYYYYFLNGTLYKECCYSCQFAQYSRIGDISLGDFWGITDYEAKNKYNEGLSLCLLNTQKSIEVFDKIKEKILYEEITEDVAKRNNGQLNTPTKKCNIREKLIKKYEKDGYKALEREFNVKNFFNIRKYISPQIIYNMKKILKR